MAKKLSVLKGLHPHVQAGVKALQAGLITPEELTVLGKTGNLGKLAKLLEAL